MKKFNFKWLLLSFILSIASITQMEAASRRIYCYQDQNWWTKDGACCGVYAWKSTDESDKNKAWPGVKMTETSSGSHIWYGDIDTKYDRVIFTRVGSDGSDYGAKTGNLTLNANDNLYVINGSETWGDPGATGYWSDYAPSIAVIGSMNSWNALTNPFSTNTVSISLSANTTYEFKIIDGMTWYGYGDSDGDQSFVGQSDKSNTLVNGKNNLRLMTAGAGSYTFTWDATNKKVTVSYPTVTHPSSDYVYYKNTKGWSNVYAYLYGGTGNVWAGTKMSSFNFDGANYYYAALGDNTSVTFNQGNGTNQDDLKTITSNKGKYYDPSSSSWKSFTATLSLDHQSPTNTPAPNSVTVTYNAATNINTDVITTTPTKTGYTFGGYYTSKAGSGTQMINTSEKIPSDLSGYTTSGKWTKNGSSISMTIYAKWTQTLNLNSNGATSAGTTSVTATFNGSIGSIATAPSKTNYTFGGWYPNSDGTGVQVINTSKALQSSKSGWTDSNTKWIHAGASTLYAKWTQGTTVNANNGSANSTYTATWNNTSISIASAPTRTGYTLNGYYAESGCTNKIAAANGALQKSVTVSDVAWTDASNKWAHTAAAATIYAGWTPITYTVTLKPGVGGEGDDGSMTVDYDATAHKGDMSYSFTQTGYHISGWYNQTEVDGSIKVLNANGTFVSSASGYITEGKWTKDSNCDLYAWWEGNEYTITLDVDETNKGTFTGATGSVTATYDATLPSIGGTLPVAANGYRYMGMYTAANGGGVALTDSLNNWLSDVTDYISSGKWVHVGDVELYAYYKQAEITGITFTDGAVVAPSTSKTVTVVLNPQPTGTTTVCWRVLYSNDNPMDPQPSFSSVSGNSVSFTAPAASGMYKMEAVLHLGGGCEGTTLDSTVVNFQVAGDHDVTVQYKDANGTVIAASSTVTGRPLVWSSGITAPTIFGYTFHHWLAGDGVTLSEDGTNAKTGARADSSVVSPIYIKAVYDGKLTAVYNVNKYIYLDLSQQFGAAEWTAPYVYFYKAAGYWDGSKGTGARNENCVGYGAMTNIDGTSIWYYDYGSVSNFGGVIAFTKEDKHDQENFWETEAIYRGDFSEGTPVFVPHMGQVETTKNEKCDYYNAGYWVTYLGEKTGYTLRIKNNSTDALIKEIPFTSGDKRMAMKAVTDLEASHTYKFEIMRDNGKYYKNWSAMDYAHREGDWEFTEAMTIGTIATTASGDYTFTLSYSDYITAGVGDKNYQLRINVEYPVAAGNYRLIYKDDIQTKFLTSDNIANTASSTDIVSFFVRPSKNPTLYKLTANIALDGAVSWDTTKTNLITAAMLTSPITKDSVYNFNLVMDGEGALSVESVEGYTGNFYIRTDAANNKWDNYRASDHMMTYSEYSEKNSDYSHYFMAFVENGANVKCVIANDYSPCISDTIIQHEYRGGDAAHVDASGFIQADANIRFMWNKNNNAVYRAYLARGKNDGSQFLVLAGTDSDNILDPSGNALSNETNNNHKGGDHCMQFVDNENWIYEANVKIVPGTFVKLTALFHGATFYYKGDDGDGAFDKDHAIKLMDGTGDAQLVRVLYDFKTDRLVAAWMPSGEIEGNKEINADVMFVREHQGDIAQITFKDGDSKISEIKTAYAVLRFNKWTLNNKSKASGHAVLDPSASRYERDLFYVSFPFRVAMNEVFGFGKYGQHWIIEYYDGEGRAANGFWADTPTYWRYVTDRKGKFFEPNQGYIIALDLDELGESSSVWDNDVEQVELYFPSYGTMGNITNSTVEHTLPAHTYDPSAHPTHKDDRSIADSHWNIMSVPTYVNTSNITFANTTWTATRPSFLYAWNMDDNSLTPRSGIGYTYHAMHAYMVQYEGNVTWTTSVTPSSIVARRAYADAPSEVEFRLELSQNEKMADQTFVRLSNDEEVTTGFAFGEDMSKEFNKTRSNIYTFIGKEQVAGNVLPMSEQTTVVPVGVKIAADGDYTFAIPEGTEGIGVTLIDNETGIRTSLSALDYTISLSAGTYDERFVLEISPVRPISTDLEAVTGDGLQVTGVRKVMIDGILYIVKDGKMFDARGNRIQ